MTSTEYAHNVPARIEPEVLRRVVHDAEAVRAQLRKVYQGPTTVPDLLLIALIARGHILLEGVPGVAKTTLVKAFAQTQQASFSRIQFTPDLLPTDITGTYIVDMRNNTFVLRRGPVFAHIVLGDEINRAPAKTQSALLQAMQEAQVTIEGKTLDLPDPFIVLATQNPVEQEGVYLLPEAQLDRFLMKVTMGYPSVEQEEQMLSRHAHGPPSCEPVLSPERVVELRTLAENVDVSSTIRSYIVGLARSTRRHPSVELGASPRASLALMQAARARALVSGRDYVNVDDVRKLVRSVFAHRIVLTSTAVINGVAVEEVVDNAMREVPYDPA